MLHGKVHAMIKIGGGCGQIGLSRHRVRYFMLKTPSVHEEFHVIIERYEMMRRVKEI